VLCRVSNKSSRDYPDGLEIVHINIMEKRVGFRHGRMDLVVSSDPGETGRAYRELEWITAWRRCRWRQEDGPLSRAGGHWRGARWAERFGGACAAVQRPGFHRRSVGSIMPIGP
jgi:hypothetical protein